MEKEKIQQKITEYLYERFIYDKDKSFQSTDSLTKSGYIDSIGIIEFIDFITKTFEVEIPDSELTPENLDSIGAATSLVVRLIENGKN